MRNTLKNRLWITPSSSRQDQRQYQQGPQPLGQQPHPIEGAGPLRPLGLFHSRIEHQPKQVLPAHLVRVVNLAISDQKYSCFSHPTPSYLFSKLP